MDYTLLAWHSLYRWLTRVRSSGSSAYRCGRPSWLSWFHMYPLVHIKSRWAVRTAKRSILKILKKHRGLWRVYCRGQERGCERSNEKSGARGWKRTVRLGLRACEARTPLVAKMSRRPLASFQNRLRKKKKKKMTILHSWHIYVEVLQKVKIKRRNLHWNRYNNKSSDNN